MNLRRLKFITPEHSKNLYKSIAKSITWRYAVYCVNLVSMMILARLFTPEIFGTVASIGVFYLFFQVIAEAGLGPAIINLEKLDIVDRNGLFGLTLVAGTFFGLLFYLLSPLFAAYYQREQVGDVVPFVAVALFFSSAAIVPTAFLMRDQAFSRFAIAGVAAEVVSTASVLILSTLTDPLHALAAKTAFSAATSFSAVHFFSADTLFGRPRYGSKFSAIKPFMAFSAYQFGFNFINYFSRNLDNILVGRYLGAVSLGVYDKAYQLMRYPLMLLTFAMNPAIQPVVRKHVGDKDKVEHIHRDFTFKLSLVGAVAGTGIYVLADWIVKLMLGPQWSEVVPVIQVLAIAIPVQVVSSTSGSFFQAMNRADLLFLSGILSAIVTVSAIGWGILQRDLITLSWTLVIAFHINFIQTYCTMYWGIYKQTPYRYFIWMIPAGLVILAMVLRTIE